MVRFVDDDGDDGLCDSCYMEFDRLFCKVHLLVLFSVCFFFLFFLFFLSFFSFFFSPNIFPFEVDFSATLFFVQYYFFIMYDDFNMEMN